MHYKFKGYVSQGCEVWLQIKYLGFNSSVFLTKYLRVKKTWINPYLFSTIVLLEAKYTTSRYYLIT
jgi:hypothetical protein